MLACTEKLFGERACSILELPCKYLQKTVKCPFQNCGIATLCRFSRLSRVLTSLGRRASVNNDKLVMF